MSDVECDLETLTALLEDSDNEIDEKETDTKSEKAASNDNEDECDLEIITAFLDQSDSEEDEPDSSIKDGANEEPSKHVDNCSSEKEAFTQICDKSEEKNEMKSDTFALQAQLEMMQQKMKELEEQLKKQQELQSTQHATSLSPSSVHQQKNQPPPASSPSSLLRQSHSPDLKVLSGLQSKTSKQQKVSPDEQKIKNSSNDRGQTGTKLYMELDKNPFFSDDSDTHLLKTSKETKSSQFNGQGKMSYSQMVSQKRNNKEAAFETKKPENAVSMGKDLFGDSDSDWDEMDGDDKEKLSNEGKEMKKLLKQGSKERISTASKEDVEALRRKAAEKSKSWKDKTSPSSQPVLPSRTPSHHTKENDIPAVTDPFSGIRVINPKVSTLDMKLKMSDRKMIKVSRIASRVNTADLQGNWVTIAVIVHRTEPRTSSSGKTYSIWKLSDLDDCDKTISVFLFGEVYKQHWKNEVKTVVGILNPNLMDKAEKAQQDLAFTVNHPQQILVMGYSKDLGKCAGVSRAGKSCSNFINRQQGEYCTYHVKAAYKKSCSTRTELQGSCSGMTPKNVERKQRNSKDSFFFYGGETFTTQRPITNSKKDHVTLDKLQNQQGKARVTTLSMHAVDYESGKKIGKLKEDKSEFMDLLNVPSPGSMNFVKHLIKKEKTDTVDNNAKDKKPLVESVTAKQLLKQHKELMKQKLKPAQNSPSLNPLVATPMLGRGFAPGGNISLDSPNISKAKRVDYCIAKRLAIAKIRDRGGISKEDPNAVRKQTSPTGQEKIKKRVLDSIETKDDSPPEEPPKKRSKLLGNLDVNSEEFKRLMSIKSKHTGALAEVEAENEARYFMELEKREKYEDKMSSTMEMKCMVFTCKQCNYTAFKVGETCKKEGHDIKKVDAVKRFFKCKKCGWRIISIDKYPAQSCKECGEYSFERVAMYQERKGPKLPSEELSIRGNEIKNVGSHQKVYLNL